MNMAVRELYQEMIMDHNKNPRNHHDMPDATVTANGFNPLCGDKLSVYCKLVDDKIDDVSFVGCGCAISQASASLMTDALKNQTITDAHAIFERFHLMMTQAGSTEGLPSKLMVLEGVKEFPARVKCATLAWHTMEAALNKSAVVVSTE